MNQSKKITDGALLSAVYIILLLITILVPFISLFTQFLLPIPFIVFAFKHNWKPSILMLMGALFLSSLFFTVISFPLTLLAGLGGIMIGTAIHNNINAYETWARGALGFVIGLACVYLLSELVLQVNWVMEIDQVLEESIEMSQEMMGSFGFEQTEEEVETVKSIVSQIKNLIPVGIVIIATVFAFISQWVSYKVLNRLEGKNLKFPPFRNLTFPKELIWIYFVALLLTFFDIDTNSIFYLGIQNVHVLVGLLIALQGLSFIFFYAHIKKKSKALPIISVIFTVLFPFLFIYIARVIGIIDIGFSLRDRLKDGKN